jgi:hypothetical protein
VDTPFEREIEPRLTRLTSIEEGRGFVRFYVRLSRREPFGGYGLRHGADLDLEGIAALLRSSRGFETPETVASYRFFLDAVASLLLDGILRPGPRGLLDPVRASGFSVTTAGEAWLARDDALDA